MISVVVAVPMAVTIPVTVPVPVAVPVPVTIVVTVAIVDPVAIEVAPYAHEVPASRNPVAAVVVAGCPYISRSGAGRNIGYRPAAHIDPDLCGVGCGCT